jgi:hypothetical protein
MANFDSIELSLDFVCATTNGETTKSEKAIAIVNFTLDGMSFSQVCAQISQKAIPDYTV